MTIPVIRPSRQTPSDEQRVTMREWLKEGVEYYRVEVAWARYLTNTGPVAPKPLPFRTDRVYTVARWLWMDLGMDNLPAPDGFDAVADVFDEARTILARRRVKPLPRVPRVPASR